VVVVPPLHVQLAGGELGGGRRGHDDRSNCCGLAEAELRRGRGVGSWLAGVCG
jgi:hypothetical protein